MMEQILKAGDAWEEWEREPQSLFLTPMAGEEKENRGGMRGRWGIET